MAHGLSATRKVLFAENYYAPANVVEGAVVCYNTSAAQTCQLPGGAAATGVIGVCESFTGTGSASGDLLSIQKLGRGAVLLAASAVVSIGSKLIVANTSGHVKAWTNETNVDVVGISEEARTAGSGAPEMINCTLGVFNKT